MDTTEPRRGASDVVDPDSDHSPASPGNPQELPDDLPKSLDDRRSVPVFQQETEMYDAWQGKRIRPASSLQCPPRGAGTALQAWASGLQDRGLTVFNRPIPISYYPSRCETFILQPRTR